MVRFFKKLIILALASCAFIIASFVVSRNSKSATPVVCQITGIRPHALTPEQIAQVSHSHARALSLSRNSSESERLKILVLVSKLFQDQLKSLQSIQPAECEGVPTIQCGHIDTNCGFACQVHHRVACLMTSYALGVPLIHDEVRGWSYKQRWSEVFEPLGSSCRPGPNTYTVEWVGVGHEPRICMKADPVPNCNESSVAFRHPLLDGIPVPSEMGEIVDKVHPNPWLWWIGQFVSYALRLRPELRRKIDRDMAAIGFTQEVSASLHSDGGGQPIVGIQVRRTDKATEYMQSVHAVSAYFGAASQIFAGVRNGNHTRSTRPRSIFIASDDHLILRQARRRYKMPEWNLMSFPSSHTLRNMTQRSGDLYSIVRDVVILSECDYVICGYTSNICRLLLELLSARARPSFMTEDVQESGSGRVKSLDRNFPYDYIYASKRIPRRVLKY